MNVPDTLQTQVQQVVQDSVDRVLAVYPDLTLPPILITYERCYSTAGWARGPLYQVNFDPILLVANPMIFLTEIVPHEVAHIITEHIHGHDTKAHGKEWKAIMCIMGLEPNRCHSLDVSISKRKVTTYKFKCGCDTNHVYSSLMSRKIMTVGFQCIICHQKLSPAFPIIHDRQMPKQVTMGTKMDKAKWIIRRYKKRSRREVIQKLIDCAGLSRSGASTYYHNLTK